MQCPCRQQNIHDTYMPSLYNKHSQSQQIFTEQLDPYCTNYYLFGEVDTNTIPCSSPSVPPFLMDFSETSCEHTPEKSDITSPWLPPPIQLNRSHLASHHKSMNLARNEEKTQHTSTFSMCSNYAIESTSSGIPNSPDSNKDTANKDVHELTSHYAFRRDGSLKLQEQIPNATIEHRQCIIEDLKRELPSLSCNPYGNYVVQLLIQYATPFQRIQIICYMKPHFGALAINLYGHRVVATALEFSDDRGKEIIFEALLDSFKDIINHEQGNYVAQKCIKTMTTYQCKGIWENFYGRIWVTATHKFGHCVLKTLLFYAPPDVKKRIINEIRDNSLQLSKDPFGNYVVQHALEKEVGCSDLVKNDIISTILDSLDELSCNKFASNVVEKCLRNCTLERLEKVVREFILNSNKKLAKLINNQFGNYVVKTLMELVNDDQKKQIRSRTEKLLPRIRCSPAVQHLFNSNESIFCMINDSSSASSL